MIGLQRIVNKLLYFKRKKQYLPTFINTGIYFSDNAIKINIGGGKKHPRIKGWQIVDLRETADIKLDITRQRLPFDENSVDIIFTSHTLEHIYPHDLDFILKEFYRVLTPGTGFLRISVPDIRKACQAYVNNDIKFFKNSELTYTYDKAPIGGLLASWFYSYGSKVGYGHVHCFDFDYLKNWLKKYGFRKIAKSNYKQSQCEELRLDGFDLHPHDSLFVEARK